MGGVLRRKPRSASEDSEKHYGFSRKIYHTAKPGLWFFVVLLRQFSPVNPPAKSQISRSAQMSLTPSKIFTDIFRTTNNLSICKTTIHRNANNAFDVLAMSILSRDRYSNFEQD
ncbi:hypothetical protein SHA37_004244 [Salmonella enterica]|nr:hypothetical protein [Salmonella enterica]